MFAPVNIEKNENVIFIGPLDEGEYEISGETVKVKVSSRSGADYKSKTVKVTLSKQTENESNSNNSNSNNNNGSNNYNNGNNYDDSDDDMFSFPW